MASQQPDVKLINLETAITAGGVPWPRKGIHYRCHPANVGVLTAAGIDVITLANNHAADWGLPGLVETVEVLANAGVRVVGAGRNAAAAEQAAVVEVRPKAAGGAAAGDDAPAGSNAPRVLVWALGHASSGVPDEWAATATTPGVRITNLSDADVERVRRGTAAVKRVGGGDVAVVSIHWGGNWGFEVEEDHRRFARALIDRGASLVRY